MNREINKLKLLERREMMKAYDEGEEDIISDQSAGMEQPPLEKPSIGTEFIPLTREFDKIIKNNNFLNLLQTRSSKRKYSNEAISMDELAFLLWATQGVKNIVGSQRKATMRTVPSAGARHPFETYLFINRVDGLEPGLYHYLAIEHKLEFIRTIEKQNEMVSDAYGGQTFFGNAPVGFVWTVMPYRSEWRYSLDAQKYSLLDAGHIAQNLYLSCEAIGCGACAIGAYEQKLADGLLGLDSKPTDDKNNEFVVYAAAVGKIE